MAAQIKHLFVLMMENRSFDHMLGFMKAPDYDIEGLDPRALPFNQDSAKNSVYVTPNAQRHGDFPHDPNHRFLAVAEQIYGITEAGEPQTANMAGFVGNYERETGNRLDAARIMKCFAPANLPVLTTLAKEYAVCDHWFSSIPGPTLPNRLYAHCGTSRGRLDMSPDFVGGFYTVYEELANHKVPSCIFYQDWSGTLSFSGLMAHPNLFYADYNTDFAALCHGPEAHVPAYCFIEPRYNPQMDPAGGVHPANDQHPDNDVGDGEILIRNVYNAIRGNDELWHSSMLVIVYDEHGGLYDHVPPVQLPSPDNLSSVNPAFDFTTSGLRVPAVVISPYINAGTISKETYDHTSLISTALKLFTPNWPSGALFARAEQANTLDSLLDLSMVPRDDRPHFVPPPAEAQHPLEHRVVADAPLSDLQREIVAHASNLNASLARELQVRTPAQDIHNSTDANSYVRQVAAATLAAHRGLKP